MQGLSVSARAASEDAFGIFANASVIHDSNLLRSNANSNSADTMKQIAIGLNTDWKVERQRFLLSASVNDNRFDRFSMLNYQGEDLQARWSWQSGNHLSGNLGYTNNLTINSFANQQALVSNQRIQDRLFLDGSWLFHPSWQVNLGASKNRLSYPDMTQRELNREDRSWEAGLQYLAGANGKMGVKLRKTASLYPNYRFTLSNFLAMRDNGYRQEEMQFTLDWNVSGQSMLHGEAGAVRRKHAHFSRRDYRDVNLRGTYTWLTTGKLRLNASTWREVTAYDDLISSYSVNRGLGLDSSWTASAKISLNASIQHVRHAFLGDPGIVTNSTGRVDANDTFKLAVSYQPATCCNLNMSAGKERRASTQAQLNYKSTTVNISAMFKL